jgi:hypothetical protein
MFEDSLMESSNLTNRKSKWSFVAFVLNFGALFALIVWPLLHPEALPTQMMAALMVAPLRLQPLHPLLLLQKVHTKAEMLSEELQPPSRIPREVKQLNEAATPPSITGVRGMEDLGGDTAGGMSTIIGAVRAGQPSRCAVVLECTLIPDTQGTRMAHRRSLGCPGIPVERDVFVRVRSEPATFYFLFRLRPENPEQHLLTNIAEVLRLRAVKTLFAISLRSASLRMTDFVGG